MACGIDERSDWPVRALLAHQQSAATRHSNEGGASAGHQEVAWICGITFTADGGGAETAGRSRALAPKGHRNLATGSRSNALQQLPRLHFRFARVLLFCSSHVALLPGRRTISIGRRPSFFL